MRRVIRDKKRVNGSNQYSFRDVASFVGLTAENKISEPHSCHNCFCFQIENLLPCRYEYNRMTTGIIYRAGNNSINT